MKRQWKKLNGCHIQQPVEEAIRQTILTEKAKGHTLNVCIGTDSQVKGNITEFATVIVFIRKGKGGFMFIQQETIGRKIPVKERMMDEVSRSIEVAHELNSLFNSFGITPEVHADINTQPAFKSHQAFSDAKGYITGMGFMFKAKPFAFASSRCADKIVH
jgi:uncharacterized protein